MLMAAAAIMAESCGRKGGYDTPAATDTLSRLSKKAEVPVDVAHCHLAQTKEEICEIPRLLGRLPLQFAAALECPEKLPVQIVAVC